MQCHMVLGQGTVVTELRGAQDLLPRLGKRAKYYCSSAGSCCQAFCESLSSRGVGVSIVVGKHGSRLQPGEVEQEAETNTQGSGCGLQSLSLAWPSFSKAVPSRHPQTVPSPGDRGPFSCKPPHDLIFGTSAKQVRDARCCKV